MSWSVGMSGIGSGGVGVKVEVGADLVTICRDSVLISTVGAVHTTQLCPASPTTACNSAPTPRPRHA
jgi:hypothetical protein